MLPTILDFKCRNNKSLSETRNIYRQNKWSEFVMARISWRRIFNFRYITDDVIVRVCCYMILVNNVVHTPIKYSWYVRRGVFCTVQPKKLRVLYAHLFIILNDSFQIEYVCYILLYGQLELTCTWQVQGDTKNGNFWKNQQKLKKSKKKKNWQKLNHYNLPFKRQ